MAKIEKMRVAYQTFVKSTKAGGIVLIGSTIFSLLLANWLPGEVYIKFWAMKISPAFRDFDLPKSIHSWINDGLMTIFFLYAGLEIKREIIMGELSAFNKVILPIGAALGGMVVPALIYVMVNITHVQTIRGWGIPMATDIAFALGVLSLLGNKIPYSLKIFLTTLAVIDDFGAILVIAIFYSSELHFIYILLALAILLFLIIANKIGVKSLAYYLPAGVLLWFFILQSGIHPTLAGGLLALVMPFNGKEGKASPLLLLEQFLNRPVALFIMPLFALANTAILIEPANLAQTFNPSAGIGIALGLIIGKPLGIMFSCYLLIKSKKAKLPRGASWLNLLGVAILGGIGFTVAIFVTSLAYSNVYLQVTATLSILTASLIAAISGYILLSRTGKC